MKAKFSYALYKGSNGYCIYIYQNIETGKKITCKGNNLPDNKSLTYELETEEVMDKKYGKQYIVSSYAEVVEKSRNSIVAYLSSGIIKGIGKKTAEKIYDEFGKDTMDILENDMEKLRKIKGISAKKLEAIKESYKANRDKRQTVEYLLSFPQFTPKIINRILAVFKQNSLEIIKNRPYDLMNIRNITFPMVDELAKQNNLGEDSYERVYAAAKSIIYRHMQEGHCAIDKDLLGMQLIQLLNTDKVTKNNVCSYVIEAIRKRDLIYKHIKTEEKHYIYLPGIYEIEKELAKKTVSILQKETKKQDVNVWINRFTEKDKDLDQFQRKAVEMAVNNHISILTGGPGSGKTTTIKMIAKVYQHIYPERGIAFLAPTGRAARRITESTGFEAYTVHSYLGLTGTDEEPVEQTDKDDEMIKDELIIVDEVSMLDLFIAGKLFSRIENSQIVLVGDYDQLPSVGAGAVLRDFISCGQIPITELKYTHRQEEGSTICDNAEHIRQGEINLAEAEDFIFDYVEPDNETVINEPESYLKKMEDIMVKAYVEDVREYGLGNVACLCPYKEHFAGVHSMNKRIQEILNPPTGHTEYKAGNTVFRIGDLVMQLRNRDEASNGDIGIIKDIVWKEDERNVVVKFFHNESKVYNSENIEELTLAYAMSVHKSQGGEYDSVITCLCRYHYTMLKRNIPYTAFTRGKKKVRFVGEKEALKKAIENNLNKPRNTLLAFMIRELNGEWMQI